MQNNLLDPRPVDLDEIEPDDVLDRRLASRVEPVNIPAAPSIESTLAIAVEKGIDAASMEKLVMLYERIADKRAAQAFAVALAAFKAEVGPILKRSEACDKNNKVMYRFADLEAITKTVDPVLLKHGLTYTFDSSMLEGLTIVKCTVRHIDGHKESSNFTCKGSGTPIMNAAQVSASAVTFGRRYSLVLALGLTVDNDDDGRRAAAPNPAPDHDTTAPQVATREQRRQPQDAAPRVSGADLAKLKKIWEERSEKPGTLDEFKAWAAGVLERDAATLDRTSSWSIADLQKCQDVMA